MSARIAILVAGWACVALALGRLVDVRAIDHLPALITVAALVLVLQLAPMVLGRRRDQQIRVVSTALLFALLYVWGIQIAIIPIIVFTIAWGVRDRLPWSERLYTVAHFALGMAAARLVLLADIGPVDLAHTKDSLDLEDVAWMPLAVLAYVVVDTALSAVARRDERRIVVRFAAKARRRAPMLVSTIALSPVVAMLALSSWYLLPALMVPVLLLYYTAATAQAREAAALRDDLTGLPNRTALYRSLDEAIGRWRNHGVPFALLVIDLDDFKRINDTLGHAAGDQVIIEFTRVVQSQLRPGDFLARLGGDEWAVIAPRVEDVAARDLADRMRAAVATPLTIDKVRLGTTGSVGIALCPAHAREPLALLRQADVAMYQAKRKGTRAEVYSFADDPNSIDRLRLLGELREAIGSDAIELYHQPKIDTMTAAPVGVEALARWRHPERGFVPPEIFVSIAEGTDVIRLLTARVVDLAVQQAAAWHAEGLDVPVAVNVSPTDLADIALVTRVADALQAHQLPARLLNLEVTERVVVDDITLVRRHVEALRTLGVRISLDDFGTEYSTLLRLQSLPVDEIKIDRAFVEQLSSELDAGIVAAVITLAHSLGLTVVAEGVETLAQLEILRSFRCDAVQGHLVARPMPADRATRWLREHLPPAAEIARPTLRSV